MDEIKDFNYYINVFELLDKSDDKNTFINNNKRYIDFFCNDFLFNNIDSIKNKKIRSIISKIISYDLYDQKYYNKLFNFINNIEEAEFEKIDVCENQEELDEIIDVLYWKESIIKKIKFNSAYINEFNSNNIYLLNLISDSIMHLFSKIDISTFDKYDDIINDSLTFNKIINNTSKDFKFQELQFLINYIKDILSLNSVLNPKKFENNKLVEKFLNIELDDECLIMELMNIIPKKMLLKRTNNKFIEDFDSYLKSKSNSTNINNIYMECLIKNKIDLSDYEIFYSDYILTNQDNLLDNFSWLNSDEVENKFKELEHKILNGENVLLDSNLVVKLIDKFYNSKSCYNSVFMNIYQLVKSKIFYNEIEERNILEAFKNKNSNLYYERNEKFDLNNIVGLRNKSINSFLKGEIIDFSLALTLLKANIQGNIELGLYSTKAVIQSIVVNYLFSIGISVNGVFFFNNDKIGATTDFNNNIIYINNKLVNDFCNNKKSLLDRIEIFISVFHEITHIVQNNNIKNGIFDENYYTNLKESIIFSQDDGFYDNNYDKLVLEIDANVSSYKKTVKFFEKIDESFALKIQKEIMILYKNILKECNSCDNIIIAGNNLKLNMDDIFSIIIKNNPLILKDYSILELEYNFDGSKKSILDSLIFIDKNCFNNIELYFNVLNNKIEEQLKKDYDLSNIFEYSFKRKEVIDFVESIKLDKIESNFRK